MGRPRHLAGLLATALLAFFGPTVGADPCPVLRFKTDSAVVGRHGQVAFAVGVVGSQTVRNATVRIGLPAVTDVSDVKALASPSLAFRKSLGQTVVLPGSAVFFLNVVLRPKKRVLFRVKAKLAEPTSCSGKPLTFPTLVYLNEAGAPVCPSAEQDITVYAKGAGPSRPRRKKRPCPPTPSPTAAGGNNVTVPFVPFGQGQRCLEAGRQAPFDDRRTRQLASPARPVRGLQAINTPEDCWRYCARSGGYRRNFTSTGAQPPARASAAAGHAP